MTAPDITPRQRDVLELASLGLSDAQIGARLHLSETTIKRHLSVLYARWGCRGRCHAVRVGFERGVLTPTRTREAP